MDIEIHKRYMSLIKDLIKRIKQLETDIANMSQTFTTILKNHDETFDYIIYLIKHLHGLDKTHYETLEERFKNAN
jgi:hypothetical protein